MQEIAKNHWHALRIYSLLWIKPMRKLLMRNNVVRMRTKEFNGIYIHTNKRESYDREHAPNGVDFGVRSKEAQIVPLLVTNLHHMVEIIYSAQYWQSSDADVDKGTKVNHTKELRCIFLMKTPTFVSRFIVIVSTTFHQRLVRQIKCSVGRIVTVASYLNWPFIFRLMKCTIGV